jgi:hypothetical protein
MDRGNEKEGKNIIHSLSEIPLEQLLWTK